MLLLWLWQRDPGWLPALSCLLPFLSIVSQQQLPCFWVCVAKISAPVLTAETKRVSACTAAVLARLWCANTVSGPVQKCSYRPHQACEFLCLLSLFASVQSRTMGLKVRYEWCICTWACRRVLPCRRQLMDGHVAVTALPRELLCARGKNPGSLKADPHLMFLISSMWQ